MKVATQYTNFAQLLREGPPGQKHQPAVSTVPDSRYPYFPYCPYRPLPTLMSLP
jgi:hypothetical protein